MSGWKLNVDDGRQWWEYVGPEYRQTSVERYHLNSFDSSDFGPLPSARTPLEAARNGVRFYAATQTEAGHWAHDYGGPMFLMPGLLIACHVTGTVLPSEQRAEMIRYLKTLQRKDGGWGLHIEGRSTIFGSALSYASLRLLGLPASDAALAEGRAFLRAHGGAKGIPSWGKFWLAVLGVYAWEGLNPIPPELWLLPYSFPAHPGRFWCHCRMVYLPMSYIYAGRITGSLASPLVASLREELYDEPYEAIDWPSQRTNISPLDVYTPHPLFLRALNRLMVAYEGRHLQGVRQRALDMVVDHVDAEDRSTQYIDIGPVNKAMNMIVTWHAHGPGSEQLRRHVARIPDYLWLAEDGMKMQGYNGSQLWDTAFSVQAILATGLTDEFRECLSRAHRFIDSAQVREDTPEADKYFRHTSKGAWPFSTRDHGWPISDCTAEGLKAAILLAQASVGPSSLAKERLFDAVNVILSLQNADGGWATYEQKRGPDALEVLNPSEVFHGIMVDYSYVECTSACLQALSHFRRAYPYHRLDELRRSIARGASYIRAAQRPDGSWYGSWGVCFTYGTWFGILGLVSAQDSHSQSAVARAVAFLLSKQRSDGGWGETFGSCETMQYVENPTSQVVNTAWALLSLIAAQHHDLQPLEAAAGFLMSRQQPNGNWLQEGISGVFNANCAISYTGYKNIFPIWALGAHHHYSELLVRQRQLRSRI
ncbi:MAG: terpene cyclase/mutase family protein [archaeon]|nr:terpene cyclase/mutase family protein [archaeon]